MDQIVSYIDVLLQLSHFWVTLKCFLFCFFICVELHATDVDRLWSMWIVSTAQCILNISYIYQAHALFLIGSRRMMQAPVSSCNPNPVYYIKQSRDPSSHSWVHQTDNTDRDQCTPLNTLFTLDVFLLFLLLGDEGR